MLKSIGNGGNGQISLRDYFAIHFDVSVDEAIENCSSRRPTSDEILLSKVELKYKAADIMLKVREKIEHTHVHNHGQARSQTTSTKR